MAKARKAWVTKFHRSEEYTPRNKKEEQFVEAILKLKSKKDVSSLLRDLMTLSEIEEFANRLEMARLLIAGESYLSIAKKIGVSTTTVSRVAHWLFNGCGGYQKVLKR